MLSYSMKNLFLCCLLMILSTSCSEKPENPISARLSNSKRVGFAFYPINGRVLKDISIGDIIQLKRIINNSVPHNIDIKIEGIAEMYFDDNYSHDSTIGIYLHDNNYILSDTNNNYYSIDYSAFNAIFSKYNTAE